MSRKLCITAVDGHTGFTIAELLLTDQRFSKNIKEVIGLSLHPHGSRSKELATMGVQIIPHKPGRVRDMAKTLKESGADTLCLIPPAHKDKYEITVELVEAAKKAGVQNVLFLSSAGCDLADAKKQPRLREFIELETLVLSTKGDPSTATGHSPVVIRAGFYAENLLLYSPQAKEEGVIPLPIGESHKFAPIALGDVALTVATVLSAHGKHGFHDKHRGQLIVLTGPMLAAGEELATAASQALGVEMKFENISEYVLLTCTSHFASLTPLPYTYCSLTYNPAPLSRFPNVPTPTPHITNAPPPTHRAEAKKVLRAQSDSDPSELQYLLDYYSLVREGKTNYISTAAFHDVTGVHPQEPVEFFKAYAKEFKAEEHESKKRKVATRGS